MSAYIEINDDKHFTRIRVRPEVARFAIDMEYVLLANDHKGGWGPEQNPANTIQFFKDKLEEEVDELRYEMNEIDEDRGDPSKLLQEAADVANIAMMIADNWGKR